MTKREVVRESVRMLGRTGTRIAGVLLNKVDIERDKYYYSGYYSYARYGYYGDAPPDKATARTTVKPEGKAG